MAPPVTPGIEAPESPRSFEPAAPFCIGGTGACRWYGWQTLLADAGAFGATIALAETRQFELKTVGEIGVGVGATFTPVVHGAHGSPSKVFVSAAGRLVLPIILAQGHESDARSRCHPGSDCDSDGAWLVGAGTGLLIMSAVDALLLSYDHEIPATEPSIAWGVQAAPVRGGAMVGVGGAF